MNLFNIENIQIVYAQQRALGWEWPKASSTEVTVLLVILMLLILSYFIVQQIFARIKAKETKNLMALAKMRKLKLSNNQIKMLNYIIKLHKLSSPEQVYAERELFEKSIGQFMLEAKNQQRPLENVCKDISLAYENIYNSSRPKRELIELKDIDINQIIFFTPENENDNVLFGRIISTDDKSIIVKIFEQQHDTDFLKNDTVINVLIWRVGDGEYYFNTTAKFSSEWSEGLEILIPEILSKTQELVQPYMDVIIDCKFTTIKEEPTKEEYIKEETPKKKPQEPEVIRAKIFKMNNNEAIIIAREKLSHEKSYWLDFTINDFKFSLPAKMITIKFDPSITSSQCTVELKNLSPIALKVLKHYLDSLM